MTQLKTPLVDARAKRDWSSLTPFLGLGLVLVAAVIFAPTFFKPENLGNLSRQAGILAVVAAGQTLVLLVGGIDLSVGAVMTLSMVIVARMCQGHNTRIWYALFVVFVVSLSVGAVNAFLVVARRVPPFVATLATAVLIGGIQTWYTQGVPSGSVPPKLATMGNGKLLGIPVPTLLGLAVVAITAIVLRHTVWGRWVYATGSNPGAARVSGVPVKPIVAGSFILSSVFALFGGILLGGYAGYVDSYLGAGFDLDSIAAAVIGGTSFAGGKGGVWRSLIGSMIISGALNMIVLAGASEWLQLFIKGAVVILAVAVQTARWEGGRS
jgi:ribose transport system permease protein